MNNYQYLVRMKLFQIITAACLVAIVATLDVAAQTVLQRDKVNSVSTAVPFLTIAPDSRSSSMGDVGVATTPDANSMHWNPAKYAFIEHEGGVALSYSPWLRKLVDDMNLLYLTGYKRFGKYQVVAASLRYFDMGDIIFTDINGSVLRAGKPNEFAIDAGYSRMFSDNISAAMAFRYIRSDIASGISNSSMKAKAGNSFAADIAVYYHSELRLFDKPGKWALGADISNIGAKMTYSNDKEKIFLPTNLRFGGTISLDLDNNNTLGLSLDFNKLLVPTPPITDPNTGEIIDGKDPDVGIVQGMFQSFYDAPGGFSEEMHEFTYGIGAEYLYRKLFAVRAGYFHEHPTKGNRRFFSMGVGIKMNIVGIDFSYLVPTQSLSPLGDTMRFTLVFDFGKPKS